MFSVFFWLFFLPVCAFAIPSTSKLFLWGFKASITEFLPTCQELEIKVFPFNETLNNSTQAIPPFYMHAYAPGQLPQTVLIGDDEQDLKWTVNFPPETKLLLNVVDANSSSGGVPPKLFTVVEGLNTQCIPDELKNPRKDFTVTANVTDSLETCEPWGLTIKGGVKPYTVSLLALNSPVVTNVTSTSVEDAFTYANRADPDSSLLAAVSDLTGRWAFGTPIVDTSGTTDTECPGVVSSFGFADRLAQEAAARKQEAKKRRDALLAGVLTPVCLLIVGVVGGFWWWYKKKRGGSAPGESSFPRPFRTAKRLNSSDTMERDMERGAAVMEENRQDGQVLSITAYLNGIPTAMTTAPRSTSLSSPTYTVATSLASSRPYGAADNRGSVTSHYSRPGFSSFPSRSIRTDSTRGSTKAVEAGYTDEEEHHAGGSQQGHPGPLTQDPLPQSPPQRQLSIPHPPQSAPPGVGSQDGDVVFQHTDSGMRGLRELPPPYIADGEEPIVR